MAPKKDKSDDKQLGLLQLKRNKISGNILRIKKSFTERTISLNPSEMECRLEILNSYIEQVLKVQKGSRRWIFQMMADKN